MTTEEKEVAIFVMIEQTMNFSFPLCSAKAKRRVYQSIMILDVKGLGLMGTYMKIKSLMKISNKIATNYYPENLKKLYIVNAGKLVCYFFMYYDYGQYIYL